MNALKTGPSLKDLRTAIDRRCSMILLLVHLLTMVDIILVWLADRRFMINYAAIEPSSLASAVSNVKRFFNC